ncbi:hypothetical protein KPL70_025306 [Citrus sinensis]|nr:hypothetical protein KPL70_025306 [Citrus sinensis]
MDSLLCRASSFSSSSSGRTSDSKNVVNSEEFVIEDFNKAIDNWELPKTDLSKANTVIPKPIQWKDVNLLDEWILEGATAPVIPKQLEPNTELQNVTQYSDGKVKLSFRRSTSTRFSDKDSCSSILSLERKVSKIPSFINLPFQYVKSQPRFSTSDIPSSSIHSIDYTTSVPHPIYTSKLQNVIQYSDGKVKLSFRRSTSTRFSDKDSCSSILSLERKVSKIPSFINLPFQYVKSQPRFSTSDIPSSSIHSVDYTTSVPHPLYTSSQHEQRQEEKEPSPPTSPTFSTVTEIKEIQETYYEFATSHKIHILFFDWFQIYSSNNNIPYPFKESNPITIRKKATVWNLSDSDKIIESEHPPLRSLTVDHGEPTVQIRASPYKIPKPNDSDANLSSIIQQNNLCNTNLNTIGKQLTRIESQFQKSTIAVSSVSTKSDYDKKLKEPIFKPFQVSKTSQKLVQESKSDFAKAIRDQLDRIEASSSSSSKVQIAPDSAQSSKIGVLEYDNVSIASSDIEAFKEEPPTPKANKIHWDLTLPTVKTPPDLAIDNRPSALNQSRFNASSVYEWNIDGMSEYNILGLLQQMTMAANAYKTQSGTSDRAIAEILIAGFIGQLKGWWDHLLTQQQQLDVRNSIQVDENGALILDEFNSSIQDAVATLILTISLHFIGDPSHLRDKNAELLHNLRCRKLSEFQSYKTTFFTRLFLMDDANHITWKEKFIAGLPTLL